MKMIVLVLAQLLGALPGVAQAQLPPLSGPYPAALERLTLAQAEVMFAERNRELQAAQRGVEAAEADVVSAGARPNPTFSLGSTASPTTGIGAGGLREKRVDTTVSLSQLFERGNKRELRTDSARYSAAAAASDRSDVERQQKLLLHAGYYELVLAQEKLRISSDTAELFQRTVDAAEQRQRAGDISPSDVARISVDALRAQNDARAARADQEKAQVALAYMIGAEKEAPRIVAADDWPDVQAPALALDVEGAISARPDVQAAEARLSAAQKNRDLALALRTRDVTAGVQYERFPGDTTNNSVGVIFSVPLFVNYYYQGEIRRAEVEMQAAQDSLERSRAQAQGDISGSASLLRSSFERVRRFREVLLAAARKAAEGAEFAYSRGAIGVMDLLDARRQLYATRLEAAAVSADYAKALQAWRAATSNLPARAAARPGAGY
jgi:cobalt-zinc-cadmium efflux system outer membrane protein